MPIENLFPQPIGIYKLDRQLTEKEHKFICEQKRVANVGNNTSLDNFVLNNQEIAEIKNFIDQSVNDYFFKIYNPKHKIYLKITQSWCNYTKKGEHHHKHAHPNSFVSGVFYPQANKENDKIYFYRGGFQQFKFSPKEWNIWNSESWWFPVETGDLMIFPSSLEHMVEQVKNEQERISLSFNTFPVGHLGEDSELTRLQIGELNGSLCIS